MKTFLINFMLGIVLGLIYAAVMNKANKGD